MYAIFISILESRWHWEGAMGSGNLERVKSPKKASFAEQIQRCHIILLLKM